MGADGDAVLVGERHGLLHHDRVAAVEAAGDIGGGDERDDRVVGAHRPVAEALAAVAVDVDGAGLGHARSSAAFASLRRLQMSLMTATPSAASTLRKVSGPLGWIWPILPRSAEMTVAILA